MRPVFSLELKKEEFLQYYWYLYELKDICKSYHLPTYGSKADLNERILLLLDGKKDLIQDHTKNFRSSKTKKEVTLDMLLVGEGFAFNDEVRNFFSKHYHVSRFHFPKEMVVFVREAKASGNRNLTIRDLMNFYDQNKESFGMNKKDEDTLQWNTFVRDFSNDPSTQRYQPRMKAAATLWKCVREAAGSKKYNHDLLNRYQDVMKKFE